MSDDQKFDEFLRRHDLPSPTAPAREWVAIEARIGAGEVSWPQILKNSVRAFDFWAPSLAMSALALIAVTIFIRLDEAPSSSEVVGLISELYTTDLISSTAYDAGLSK